MLLLQKDGYGVEQGIPTLLMAAGSFDDILAITGFTTCLGVAFATGVAACDCFHRGNSVTGGGHAPAPVCRSNGAFSSLLAQGSTWYNLLRGALEVAGGLLAGLLLGFVIQYFPSVDQVCLYPDISTFQRQLCPPDET